MIRPNPLPKDLNGRQTTKEEWDSYEIALKNHHAFCDFKESWANDVFLLIEAHGIEKAKFKIKEAIHMARMMDAPNEPGYYRANND